jgi:hypothetical protein
MGRFLAEDPAGYASGQTNLYVFNGNDPYLNARGIDWSKLEGQGPWHPGGSAGAGFLDAFTFGRFTQYVAGGNGPSNGYYFAGMGVGIAAQVAFGGAGIGRAATAIGLGRFAGAATKAYTAYAVVGDAVGVYDSYSAYRDGTFTPLHALGFAPTIGYAGAALRGLRSARTFGRNVARIDDAADGIQTARLATPQGQYDNAGLLPIIQPECFVADTQVAVPSIFEARYFAGTTLDTNDGSGSWVACGLASLLGASVLLGDRKKRSRQIPEADEWDAEGLWWIERDPDLDVSELDFEDVCDELLTGSPGMS